MRFSKTISFRLNQDLVMLHTTPSHFFIIVYQSRLSLGNYQKTTDKLTPGTKLIIAAKTA